MVIRLHKTYAYLNPMKFTVYNCPNAVTITYSQYKSASSTKMNSSPTGISW